MIINTVASAEIHSRYDGRKKLIDMHIHPILLDGILSGIGCDMTPAQAREVASTLVRLADAVEEDNKVTNVGDETPQEELDTLFLSMLKPPAPSIKRDIFERAKGRFTAEGAPLGVIMNDRQVMLLPGMTADVGNTGPGAYDFITYRGFEIIMREDELSDRDDCPEYHGPFFIGPDMTEVPDIEAAKKFLDEKLTPIPATKPEPGNDPKEMTITIAQAITLHNKWNDEPTGRPFREFLSTVMPMFGGDGAVIVPWCGMHLAIEKDGYSHS